MAQPFPAFLKALRLKQKVAIAELADATSLRVGTLYTYESGRRGIPEDKAQIIRGVLCLTDEERREFDRLYAQADHDRPHSPLEVGFDSALASLKVGQLNYPPFSGDPQAFVNKFLQSLFDLAAIRLVPIAEPIDPTDGYTVFDMKERLRWIDDHRADLLINAVSAQRMKKLSFLLMPVRISINAVILQGDEASLEAAQRLLVRGESSPAFDYRILAIENELGHSYVNKAIRAIGETLTIVRTLDPEILAEKMRYPPGRRIMLIADEITALAVVAKLDGAGVLVLPPSTDESVVHSADRRYLPAHFLGLGFKRQANNSLLSYLREAMELFLATEMETVAEMYEDLYRALVTQIAASARPSGTGLYRSSGRRIESVKPLAVDKDFSPYQERALASLRLQNARAFSLRCLNLSRRSLAELPPELSAWEKVLTRTRERVQLTNARDRVHVREIVVSAMKAVVGVDPLSSFSESYRQYFIEATDADHWANFKATLEREFDVSLRELKGPGSSTLRELEHLIELLRGCLRMQDGESAKSLPKQKFIQADSIYPFERLEDFVSEIQRILEDTPESTNVISTKSLHGANSEIDDAFWELWNDYEREFGSSEALEKDEFGDSEDGKASLPIRILAFSHGEPVGFLVAKSRPFQKQDGLEVTDLFVVRQMRKSGISRRLIRKVIDVAPPDCRFIWLAGRHLKRITQAFARSGFSRLRRDEGSPITDAPYFYQLYGTTFEKVGLVKWTDGEGI